MFRTSNIFYKLTQENEDAASELLCNIFRTKYIRDLSLGFLGISPDALESIKIENIITRKSIYGGGIPDIIIENKDSIFFIENKIRIERELEEYQQTTYPEHIKKNSKIHKGYIFLIPENYKDEAKIDKLKEKYSFISKTYWKDLLEYLYKKEIHNESPILKEALDYFSNIVSDKSVVETRLNINEVVIMYNLKDLYNSLTLIDKINQMVSNTAEKIVKELGQNFDVGKPQNNQFGRGKYLNYKNKDSIFYGLSFNENVLEKQNGDFVYSVAILENDLKTKNIDEDLYQKHSDGEWLYIKIDRRTLVENDQENILIDNVVDIIKNVFLKNI